MHAPGFTIANASVLDGTGAPEQLADVVVRGDRIDAVGPAAADPSAEGVVDGSGLVLAPGFVDVHTHDDWAVLLSPEHHSKILQGVTSVVIGNCGSSVFPVTENLLGVAPFDRLSEYFDALGEREPAVNVVALAGHGSIRTSVMGLRTDRGPDAAEMVELGRLTEQAMEDGAVGMSSGLAYEPGRYAAPDELVVLNRIVADAGGVYATHMRDEAAGLLDSVDESIAVAESAGVALQISHLKAAGAANWGTVSEALRRIDDARDRGVDVMADQYPYTRGSSLLEQVIRGGAFDGPSAFGTLSGDQVHIAAAPRHPEWEGRTITEIAADEDVAPRAMADRIVEAEGRSCIVVIDIMAEEDVRQVMAHPAVMIGTDGLPVGDKPHPRLGHTYPRILGRYVREQQLIGLAEAVHRMTLMPARRFGFQNRGEIRAGAYADLVLFDPATVADTGTYAEPETVPDGIHGVWVNGARVVDRGEPTGLRSGRVIART